MASSSGPDVNNSSNNNSSNAFGGRTLKRFCSRIVNPSRETSSRLGSPAAINQVLSDDAQARIDTQSPRCASPPTPNFASLSFHDPIIADDTQDDPSIDEAAYEALIKDSKSRSRGRGLFDRYGLDIEKSGLTVSRHSPDAVPKARVLRTEKDIRVRKSHTCCQCSKEFGSDPHCGACSHERCKNCPRYPPGKKHRDRTDAARQTMPTAADKRPPSAAASISARSDGSTRPASTMYLHMPNSINYQAMQPRPVMFNRLRQICCACNTHFNPPDAPRCAKCLHRQCPGCRQDHATVMRKRQRELDLDEALGEMEADMDDGTGANDDDDDNNPMEMRCRPHIPDMRDWHRNVDASSRQSQRRDCRECGSHFVCRLEACSICEHSRCMDCARRATRSSSATSSEQRQSPSAGEVGPQLYALLSEGFS